AGQIYPGAGAHGGGKLLAHVRPETGDPQPSCRGQSSDAGAHDEDAQGHRSYASGGRWTRVGAKTLPAPTGGRKSRSSRRPICSRRARPAARIVAVMAPTFNAI